MSRAERIADVRDQIDQLQIWFASRPYGWRERATPEQLQQWTDRDREQDNLCDRLADLEG